MLLRPPALRRQVQGGQHVELEAQLVEVVLRVVAQALRELQPVLVHLLRRHGNLREQGILRQHDILEFRFLGRLEGGRIGVVERLFLGGVDGAFGL